MRLSHSLVLISLALLAACSDEGPITPSVPTALIPVTAGPITGTVGGSLPVTVRVVDDAERGVAGVTVTFTLPPLSGVLAESSVVSDANGDATATWALPNFPGEYPLTASSSGLTSLTLSADVVVGPPTAITIIGGDTLTGVVGTTTDTVLVVRITDGLGNGIAGRAVTFTPTAGSGAVSATSAMTDNDGVVATTWTLGPAAGVQFVTVATDGFPDRSIPAVAMLPANPRRVAVSQSIQAACRIDDSGIASCWGDNAYASLGTGDTHRRVGPTVVNGDERYIEIAGNGVFLEYAGGFCALTTAGSIWCWGGTSGYTANGQRRRVTSTTPMARLTMGGAFGCALDEQGYAWCWGDNGSGQLGVGDNTARTSPARVSSTLRFREISAGRTHACGLTRTGEVWCWGSNTSGQLGDGSTVNRTRPTRVSSAFRFMSVGTGTGHSCAVALDGKMFCWGEANEGAVLGDGQSGPLVIATPRHVQTATSFSRVFLGYRATCGVQPAGATLCWGVNQSYRLGTDLTWGIQAAAPISGNHRFEEIGLGFHFGCGATTTDEVRCWGDSQDGALGIPDPRIFTTPQPVIGGHTFTQVATGSTHSCGLKANGTVWCWGSNSVGQFGAPTPANALQPVQISGIPAMTALDASGWNTCGLDAAGGVWCSGHGSAGQIGDGSFLGRTVMTQAAVPPMTAISVGNSHVCALTVAGTPWCWGRGAGQGAQSLALPHAVPTPEPLVMVSAAAAIGCGVGVSGAGYCWFVNTASDPSVKLMLGGTSVTSVATSLYSEGCFFTVAGVVRCKDLQQVAERQPGVMPLMGFPLGANVRCGTSSAGGSSCWRLGDPVPPEFVWEWSQVDISYTENTCALTPAGAAYCWGWNHEGQLGMGVIAERIIPLPVLVP